MWYDSSNQFFKNVGLIIRKKYNIRPRLFQEPGGSDPFSQYIVVKWDDPDIKEPQELKILVKSDEIGPARINDFMLLFDRAMKNEYPEFLL